MIDTDINLEIRELERLVGEMDGVHDVVIVRVNQSNGSPSLKAFVEAEDNHQIDGQLIIQHCLTKSSRGRAPSSVTFCKIPRTPSGKIARLILLEQLAG